MLSSLLLLLSGLGAGADTLFDDFSGTGPLIGYTTNNASALPGVQRSNGRYRADLLDNTNNVTLHFNQDQGRLDAKRVAFPFEVIARNVGIGTLADSQQAPPGRSNTFIFAGVQVHVLNLESRNSSHVVVGHRGNTWYTIEGKNTFNGNSRQNDTGAGTAPAGRADLRIVGTANRDLVVYWQEPNFGSPANDNWNLYRGTGELPGTQPNYGAEVYVGMITYAFNFNGIPFVGTADALEVPGGPSVLFADSFEN